MADPEITKIPIKSTAAPGQTISPSLDPNTPNTAEQEQPHISQQIPPSSFSDEINLFTGHQAEVIADSEQLPADIPAPPPARPLVVEAASDSNGPFPGKLATIVLAILFLLISASLFSFINYRSDQAAQRLLEAQEAWNKSHQADLKNSSFNQLSATNLSADSASITDLSTNNITNSDTVTTKDLVVTGTSNLGGDTTIDGNQTITGAVTANTFSGNGSDLSNLNADSITDGTLNDARLTTNVTLQGNSFNGAGLLLRLNSQGQVANSLLNSQVSILGQSIQNNEVDNDLTIDSTGNLDWLALSNYPNACGPGQAITTLGDTVTCEPFAGGNPSDYIHNTTSAQAADFNITGSGTVGGTLTAALFSGDGSALTNLNASQLTAGTLPSTRLSGDYAGITGTGALATGSISSGFGTISTGNNITTTATVQGNVINAASTFQLNGVDINVSGILSNVAYQNQANNFSQSQTISAVSGKTTLALTSTGANTGITIGGDVNLYRSAADVLKTDDYFYSATNIYAGGQLTVNLDNAAGGAESLRVYGSTLSSTGAASAPVFTSFVNGDAQSGYNQGRFRIFTDGTQNWGDGTSATDTNLYRSGANQLKTDDQLVVGAGLNVTGVSVLQNTSGGAGGSYALLLGAGESDYRLRVRNDGVLEWGDGAGAFDTNLYRNSANFLRTDDTFGTASDLYARHGAAAQVAIGAAGPSSEAGIQFGSAGDTNLYRSAAATLKTDGSLQIQGTVSIGANSPSASIGLAVDKDFGSSPVDQSRGESISVTASPSADFNGAYGVTNQIIIAPATTTTTAYANGNLTQAFFQGSGGTVTALTGIQARTGVSGTSPTGTVTQGVALYADSIANFGGGSPSVTYTTQKGLHVSNQGAGSGSGGLTIQNAVGIDVLAQTGATTSNIGVRIAKGDTYALQLSDTGGTAAGGITFGTDTNLYRNATNLLATDNFFRTYTGLQTYNGATDAVGFGFLQGGSSEAFKIRYAGSGGSTYLEWGNWDGTSVDTNLYRSAADTLQTDSNFVISNGNTLSVDNGSNFNQILLGYSGANYQHAIKTDHNGGVAGGNSLSIYLWTPADAVGTVGTLDVANFTGNGQLQLPVTGSNAGLLIGGDTNLYRVAADVLQTNDSFRAAGQVRASGGTATQVEAGSVGGFAGITFGNTADTVLYRIAAKILRSDGRIDLFNTNATDIAYSSQYTGTGFVPFYIQGDGKTWWGSGSGIVDTNLYRIGVNSLGTDGAFFAGNSIIAGFNGAGAFQSYTADGNFSVVNYVNGAATQPTYDIRGNGTIEWGAGGTSAIDTNLYRSAADTLKTDDSLVVGTNLTVNGTGGIRTNNVTAGNAALQNFLVAGDANAAVRLEGDGKIQWGPGGASAVDTNLYRAGANVLKSDDTFIAQGGLIAADGLSTKVAIGGSATGTAGFLFGSAGDTNLYRAGAGTLQTNGHLVIEASSDSPAIITKAFTGQFANLQEWRNSTGTTIAQVAVNGGFFTTAYLFANSGLATQTSIGYNSTTGMQESRIEFGSAGDTSLYRSAANTLKTDGDLVLTQNNAINFTGAVSSNFRLGNELGIATGNIVLQRTAGSGSPYLYAADSSTVGLRVNLASGELAWGAGTVTMDTNLYRVGTAALKTDGDLYAGANVIAEHGQDYQVNIGWTPGGLAGIRFGSANDTNLYRPGANTLRTDGAFQILQADSALGLLVQTPSAGVDQAWFQVSGDTNPRTAIQGNMISFGPGNAALDTNLYRYAGGNLKTDSYFRAGGNVIARDGGTTAEVGAVGPSNEVGLELAGDTNLYRQGAGQLRTDGAFITGSYVIVQHGLYIDRTDAGSDGGLHFGSLEDVDLSRSGAGALLLKGTSNSSSALQIQDSTGNAVMNVSTNNFSGGANGANTILSLAKDSGTSRSINAAGSINASGADYAEYIPWSGPNPAQGTVVSYAGSSYVVSDQTTAAFVGNDNFSGNSILVTFAGQVPVRITGTVHTGDILIDNHDGTAKGIDPSQATVSDYLAKLGIAQTDSSGGTVMAAIGTTSANVATNLNGSSAPGNSVQSTNSFTDLQVSGIATIATLNVSGTAMISTLRITDSVTIDSPYITLNDNIRGIDKAIAAGATSVDVNFTAAYPDSDYAVQCTPSYDTTCYVTDKTESGFTIKLGTAAPDGNKTVDWFATR